LVGNDGILRADRAHKAVACIVGHDGVEQALVQVDAGGDPNSTFSPMHQIGQEPTGGLTEYQATTSTFGIMPMPGEVGE
jgi:hypothetical protein